MYSNGLSIDRSRNPQGNLDCGYSEIFSSSWLPGRGKHQLCPSLHLPVCASPIFSSPMQQLCEFRKSEASEDKVSAGQGADPKPEAPKDVLLFLRMMVR